MRASRWQFSRRSQAKSNRSDNRRRRIRVEVLEDRRLLAIQDLSSSPAKITAIGSDDVIIAHSVQGIARRN